MRALSQIIRSNLRLEKFRDVKTHIGQQEVAAHQVRGEAAEAAPAAGRDAGHGSEVHP